MPAWRRLRNTRDFARVERQGVRGGGDIVMVTVRKGPGRVGFVVSKKVDNRASVRNRVKRRLRDIARQAKDAYVRRPGGSVDVVVTARAAATDQSYLQLKALFDAALADALARLARAPRR